MIVKRFRYIVCLYCACLFLLGCGKHEYRHVLLQIDSLADVRPDSAVKCIDAIKTDVSAMPKADQWYYRLLVWKSGLKQDTLYQSPQEIDSIVNYYADNADDSMLAQVYYYAGATRYLQHDAPLAIDYFQKALDILPDEPKDDGLRAKCYYMIGEIYIYQQMYPEAIHVHRKALYLDKKLGNRQRMIYDNIDLAWSYNNSDSLDSVVSCLDRAKNIALEIGDSASFSEVEVQLANFYVFKKHDKLQARQHLHLAFPGCSTNNLNSLYSLAFCTYDFLNQEDSAKYFCEKLLGMPNIYAKQDAHQWLALYYGRRGDAKRMREHLEAFKLWSDSVKTVSAVEYVAKAHAMYDYKLREQRNAELERENTSQRIRIYSLIALFFFLSVATASGIFYLYRKNKQRRDKMQRIVEKVRLLQNETMAKDKEKIEELNKKLASFEQDEISRDVIESEKESLEKAVQNEETVNCSVSEQNIMIRGSKIYKDLQKRLDKNKGMSQKQEKELESILFNEYPSFEKNLLNFKEMSAVEHSVCLLLKANFSFREVSVLVSKDYESIHSICRRLCKKNFGEEKSGTAWRNTILEL